MLRYRPQARGRAAVLAAAAIAWKRPAGPARPGSRCAWTLICWSRAWLSAARPPSSLKYALIAVLLPASVAGSWRGRSCAAYLLILLTPLVVGVNAAVPLVRPNEVLIVLFGVAHRPRWAGRRADRRTPLAPTGQGRFSLITLGVTSSVLPLLMMVARQRPITPDDLLYCIVIWKLLAEYVIVRSVITTKRAGHAVPVAVDARRGDRVPHRHPPVAEPAGRARACWRSTTRRSGRPSGQHRPRQLPARRCRPPLPIWPS